MGIYPWAVVGSVGEGVPEDASAFQNADQDSCGFSGPEAAELSGVSYRQLDYWARQGWLVPSERGTNGVSRRVYTSNDVVRLAALGHLGRSRVDVGSYGLATGRLRLPEDGDFVIVWAVHNKQVHVTGADELRAVASDPGRYVIFDPAAVLGALHRYRQSVGGTRRRRRTFSAEYKLAVVAEYERLSAPGAKGALLRREGLHTSHLLAWRRGRSSGALRLPPTGENPLFGMNPRRSRTDRPSPSHNGAAPIVSWVENDDIAPEMAS